MKATIKKPAFLWDYDLTEKEVHTILKGKECRQKDWLISRILQHASWQTLWEYLDLKTIQEHLDHLPINNKLKSHWHYALNRWNSNTSPTS